MAKKVVAVGALFANDLDQVRLQLIPHTSSFLYLQRFEQSEGERVGHHSEMMMCVFIYVCVCVCVCVCMCVCV